MFSERSKDYMIWTRVDRLRAKPKKNKQTLGQESQQIAPMNLNQAGRCLNLEGVRWRGEHRYKSDNLYILIGNVCPLLLLQIDDPANFQRTHEPRLLVYEPHRCLPALHKRLGI